MDTDSYPRCPLSFPLKPRVISRKHMFPITWQLQNNTRREAPPWRQGSSEVQIRLPSPSHLEDFGYPNPTKAEIVGNHGGSHRMNSFQAVLRTCYSQSPYAPKPCLSTAAGFFLLTPTPFLFTCCFLNLCEETCLP